jgi:hypothetical protein
VLDSREPPGGDFVAFVEKIEREQLARAMLPHKLPHLSAGGKVVTDEAPAEGARALSAGEAQRVLQMLKTQGRDGTSAPLGAMVGVILGAALIAFGLLAEGGFVLLILGAVLLWHGLRKLRRARGGPAGSPGQHIDPSFGRKTAGAPRRDGA